MRRGAEFWAKQLNAKGGLLGRPIELHVEDTGGDPATCVRKAQHVVERDDCHLLFGMMLSSEALAVVPKLAEWNAIFMSSDNGDGRLTGSSFVPNFFRANISGPMETRAISLWLRQAEFKNFYAHRHGLCLGPQQHRRVQGRGEEGQEEFRRRGLIRRSEPRTSPPTSRRSASPAPMPASS